MILKGSQRGGAGNLAAHLLNIRENDHVTVEELRGFTASDLHGALSEAHAISKATRCKQFMFSLSLNPPKDAEASIDDLRDAAERAESALGLTGQPRAIIIHEKNGRRHAHVVWSRIATDMKAINLPFFKNRMSELSKELYLEHGWELPQGHCTNGWKNPLNFTLAEWQQCKRLGIDPREIKQVFQTCFQRSDSAHAFRAALEEHGYSLARGDRRGFVAVDLQGTVFSISRYASVKTKELNARLGSLDALPSVPDVIERNTKRLTERMRSLLRESRETQAHDLHALAQDRQGMTRAHRQERDVLLKGQQDRWNRETKDRQQRFRKGVAGLWDKLTGRAGNIRRMNEAEALGAFRRDQMQRERLFKQQHRERQELQRQIDACQRDQREARQKAVKHVAFLLELDTLKKMTDRPRVNRTRGPSFH